MGEVYRALDTRLQRSVAIKILPAQFPSDLVRRQRFEREAKTISSLNHPNICTGWDYSQNRFVASQRAVRLFEVNYAKDAVVTQISGPFGPLTAWMP